MAIALAKLNTVNTVVLPHAPMKGALHVKKKRNSSQVNFKAKDKARKVCTISFRSFSIFRRFFALLLKTSNTKLQSIYNSFSSL